jgi:hypothetical protein
MKRPGQTFDNPEGITPEEARQDYWNEIEDLRIWIVDDWTTDEQLRAKLAELDYKGMRSFTESFPPVKFQGIIAAQPNGTVERFDQIAIEINSSYREGTLTVQQVRKFADEMRALCYQ